MSAQLSVTNVSGSGKVMPSTRERQRDEDQQKGKDTDDIVFNQTHLGGRREAK